jgi:hypothetical protein
MTYTINIPNSNGCNLFPREETQWPVFDQSVPPKYCGEIRIIRAWQVPQIAHSKLKLSVHTDLYLTSEGHWGSSIEKAEKLLVNTPPPKSFTVKGSTLRFFFHAQWLDKKKPGTNADYRVFRDFAGQWTAEVA